MTTTDTKPLSVTRAITVPAGRERAFTVFTERFASWWPDSHHVGKVAMASPVLELTEGGRWYERGVDGSECDWGQVLAFEPPSRVVLSWHLRGDFSYDPDPAKASEIEVRFIAESPDRTRIEVAHRHIERHDDPAAVASGVGGEGGWSGLLDLFAAEVARDEA
jgi:uncharacterized protein YndB with AHSA1/START domain